MAEITKKRSPKPAPLPSAWENHLKQHYPDLATEPKNHGDTHLNTAKQTLEKLFRPSPREEIHEQVPLHEARTAILVAYLATHYPAKIRRLSPEIIAEDRDYAGKLWPRWPEQLPDIVRNGRRLSPTDRQEIPLWQDLHPQQPDGTSLFSSDYLYPATKEGMKKPAPFIDHLLTQPTFSKLMQSRELTFVAALRTLATMPDDNPYLSVEDKTQLLLTHLQARFPDTVTQKFGIYQQAGETIPIEPTWKDIFTKVTMINEQQSGRSTVTTWLDYQVISAIKDAIKRNEHLSLPHLVQMIPQTLRSHVSDTELMQAVQQSINGLPSISRITKDMIAQTVTRPTKTRRKVLTPIL